MILYRMIKQSLKHIVLFIKLTIQIKKNYLLKMHELCLENISKYLSCPLKKKTNMGREYGHFTSRSYRLIYPENLK